MSAALAEFEFALAMILRRLVFVIVATVKSLERLTPRSSLLTTTTVLDSFSLIAVATLSIASRISERLSANIAMSLSFAMLLVLSYREE